MEYLLSAVILIIAAFFFYKMLMPKADPNMTIIPHIDEEKTIAELAQKKNYRHNGKSMQTRRIAKALRKMAQAADRRELFIFERWLYDNHTYLLEQTLAQKRLGHGYMKLPCLSVPRLYTFCETVVQAGGGNVTRETVEKAVRLFHTYGALTYDEVTELENMFAFALLEYCAIWVERSSALSRSFLRAMRDAKRHRIDTDRICDDAYLYFLYRAVRDDERTAIEKLCDDNGRSIRERNESLLADLARVNGCVAAAVTSLRNMSALFTAAFALSLSPVDALLKTDAYGYAESTLETRYRYCRRVRDLAKRRKTGEISVATQAAAYSRENKRDVAFALLAPPKGKNVMRVYIGAQWLVTIALPLPFPFVFGGVGILVYFLFLPIAYALVIALSAAVCRTFFKRRFVPRKDLSQAPHDCPTLITVPTLVSNAREAREAFRNLETLIYANPQPRFSYGLLLDLLPSKEGPTRDDDGAVIDEVRTLFNGFAKRDRCFVMIRSRRRNGDGVWCGWEKKRGALIELNELLLGGRAADDHILLGQVPHATYVITLDSDTMINCADDLVEMMAHPYNADVNVIGLSMRTQNESARATGFARLFSGAVGLHAYSQSLSDPANDLFGRGNFTGKGIYRVKQFHELTGAAFCENSLLSHDFIEGAFAAYRDSDLFGMDAFPVDYSAYLTRKLRWLRGDIQFLPFLKPTVRNMAGEKVKNPLTPIDKHHIISTALFGLLPIVSLALIIVSLFVSAWLLPAAFALPIVSVLSSVRRSALGKSAAFVGETLRQLFSIAVLPTEAVYNARAIVVTLWRLLRRRRLMEWKVSAHYKGHVNLLACPVVGVAVIVVAAVFALNPIYYALGALFVSAYLFDRLSASVRREKARRSPALDALLKDEARRTWQYFVAQLNEENNYLPCDNYSQSADRWTRRTSPTDIGMGLLSVVCACKLEIVPFEEGERLATKMIDTLERAPKWKGHLYNWMNVDLTLPEPRYVSTVDSGNLSACYRIAAAFFPSQRERLLALVDRTDMAALYDEKRGLFHIGYDCSADTFDAHHYDLMGSESATAYLAAIGGGKIPRRAWNNLSRNTVRYAGKLLCSWTGGLFEYLLCPLFYPYPPDGLFGVTAKNAVRSHIAYARKRGRALWGVSECQYTAVSDDGAYGYRAFGVPYIAAHGSESDVVAPYASLMAIGYAPRAVERNLRKLIDIGARGRYGFYESIANDKVIDSYMTHHKGMSLAAVCNYLCDGALNRLTTEDGAGRASCLLVSEPADFGRSRRLRPQTALSLPADPVYPTAGDAYDRFVFLSDGKYALVLDENMGGYAYMDGYLTAFRYPNDGRSVTIEVDGRRLDLRAETFSAWQAVYAADTENVSVRCAIVAGNTGEYRTIRIKNKSSDGVRGRIGVNARPILSDAADREDAFAVTTVMDDGFVYAYRQGNELSLYFALSVIGGETVYTGSVDGTFGRRPQPRLCAETAWTVEPHETREITVRFCAAYSLDVLRQSVTMPVAAAGEAYATGMLYAPTPTTSRLGSRLLAGDGACVATSRLPCVILDAKDRSIEMRLNELSKLYRCGVPFDTFVAVPRGEQAVQAAESARMAIRRSGIEAFRAVRLERAEQLPPPTDFNPPSCALTPIAAPTRSLRPQPLLADHRTQEETDTNGILSDGQTAIYYGANGITKIVCGDSVRCAADDLPAALVAVGSRGAIFSVEPIDKDDRLSRRTEIDARYVRYACAADGLEARHTASIAYGNRATVHTVTVKNLQKSARKVDVLFAVRTALRPYRSAYESSDNAVRIYDTIDGQSVCVRADRPPESRAVGKKSFYRAGKIVQVVGLSDCEGDRTAALSFALRVPSESEQSLVITVGDQTDRRAAVTPWPQPCVTVETGNKRLDLWLQRLCFVACGLPEDDAQAKLGACGALLYLDPEAARKRIIEYAAKETTDGAILSEGAQVSSAAALMLALGVCDYVDFTADEGFFDVCVPFMERNACVWTPQKRATELREHCLRAVLGCRICDGLVVGLSGRNVALSMLWITAVVRLMPHVRDATVRLQLSDKKKRVFDAIESAWDGEWYPFAYTADGKPIGSADSESHEIYLAPQALAAFCMPHKRARRAALSAFARLAELDKGVLRQTSAEDKDEQPRGVNANGGVNMQTAHIFIRALYALGEYETAYRLIEKLTALDRPHFPMFGGLDAYEGYDSGRSGEQLYRCIVEQTVGVRFHGRRVAFAPKLPREIGEAVVRFPQYDVTAVIENGGDGTVWTVCVDGIRYNTDCITLSENLRGKTVKIVRTTA